MTTISDGKEMVGFWLAVSSILLATVGLILFDTAVMLIPLNNLKSGRCVDCSVGGFTVEETSLPLVTPVTKP